MIAEENRHQLVQSIEEAHAAGARLSPACALAGIDIRTIQRWKREGVAADRRPAALRPRPAHALSAEERAEIVRLCNEPRFSERPPSQIVPALCDEGIYVASESSFRRVLKESGQGTYRGRAREPRAVRPATTHVAQAPRQVWCWDVTWLPSRVKGRFFYLYLILDLFSRKITAHEVEEEESAEHAAALVKRAAISEDIHAEVEKPALHGDNGSILKATTVLAMLHWLGIDPSYSRPRVSNDNAFAEALFRTAKYRPQFPREGFETIDHARRWAASFVAWYNTEHRHSGLRYVTPEERHQGRDSAILEKRARVYQAAKAGNPRRWSGKTRNWTPIGAVALNPERDALAATLDKTGNGQRFAA